MNPTAVLLDFFLNPRLTNVHSLPLCQIEESASLFLPLSTSVQNVGDGGVWTLILAGPRLLQETQTDKSAGVLANKVHQCH